MSDSKAIRRYHAGVERALGLFDASNEWADYIAFLSRLLKALQASPAGADVPSKAILAKYLAQCLRPSLPSGVHQKALEAYGIIFNLLGKENLSSDLPLFFPGLAHTLSFASLGTRPWFLSLFDDHILKLSSKNLRPALKAILLSLLPGIEEESSEDFEKTMATINRLKAIFTKDNVEDVFWQSLFLACVTSTNRRMGVLVYLVKYLPKLGVSTIARENETTIATSAFVSVVTTPEPGLLIRCFASGLQDEQSLVQRGFLDLLVTHFPLNSSVIQKQASSTDIDILVSAALSIVLKRDMGLNRRLWAWFFGTDEKGSTPEETRKVSTQPTDGLVSPVEERTAVPLPESTYFHDFGQLHVVQTFENMISRKSTAPSQRARPFRILVSLMDRTAIGAPVVDAIFQALIADLKTYQAVAPSQDAFDEVYRSANVFFDSVDPHVIARHLLVLFRSRQLDLLEFVVLNFGLDDDELVRKHIPLVTSVMSFELLDMTGQSAPNQRKGSPETIARLVNILLSALPTQHTSSNGQIPLLVEQQASPNQIYELYQETAQRPIAPSVIANADMISLRHVIMAILSALEHGSTDTLLDYLTTGFDKLCARTGRHVQEVVDDTHLFAGLVRWCSHCTGSGPSTFNVARNIVAILASVISHTPEGDPAMGRHAWSIVPPLVNHFWNSLNPSDPQFHVESVELIWTLRKLSTDLLVVESTVMSLLSSPAKYDEDSHPMTRFAIFWVHSGFVRAAQGTQPASSISGDNTLSQDLLDRATLYILDMAATSAPSENPYTAWLASLSSLSYHYGAVLGAMHEQQQTPSELATCLNRLKILIPVSKSSASLWKEFTDRTGPCQFVLATSMSLIDNNQRQESLSLTALGIVRAIYEDSSSSADDELLEKLASYLQTPNSGSRFQTAILDTLQPLIVLQRDRSLPVSLLSILSGGIASPNIDLSIDKWITLLCNSVPFYDDSVFISNLLKLTDCLCRRIQWYFDIIKEMYQSSSLSSEHVLTEEKHKVINPERSITNLLAGLEYILARAHTQVTNAVRPASAHESTSSEASQLRSLANNRLTVVLCMQDAIKVCGSIWYWRPSKGFGAMAVDTKSFNYLSSRLRTRSRRMLEHLTDAEPQECLESLIGLWVVAVKMSSTPQSVMNLLQTLEAARPKFMMPAIFNAIYNRTNPQALDHSQKSTLSVDLTGLELLAFLIEYVEALEDDLLDEIWSNCTSFLRDILANPMPHRQLLLRLIDFTSILCQKMENTTFGEQSKMRRELADLCSRLFTAVFTIKPIGFDVSADPVSGSAKTEANKSALTRHRFAGGDGVGIYCRVLPIMSSILSEGDRITSIFSGISTHIISPLIKTKGFPQNITQDVIRLLMIMSKAPNTTKLWRKDVLEAFNNQNLFQNPNLSGDFGWPLVVKQLGIIDKGLMGELIGRLTPPTTAGIVFGVGAAAARAEADKQHKANLRRIALLLLSTESDMFASSLTHLMGKLEELLTATQSSSPSSSTRSEIYLILRAICLSFTSINLVAIWPTVSTELHALFEDMSRSVDASLTTYSHLEGAKLLDLLLLLKPEEFQLHEWLFITDTIDAIYPPSNLQPIASADLLRLDESESIELSSATTQGLRKPWLCTGESRSPEKQASLLGSFFSHLSIRAFEDTYSLETVDLQACRSDILLDLFSDGEQP